MAARGSRSEDAQRRGRVPAFFVMVEMDAARDPRLGLEPGDIGGDEGGSRAVFGLGEREQGRENRRRGVAAQRIADIVEIEGMRRGTVDQRRVEWAGAPVAAEDQAVAMRPADRDGLLDN